MESPKKMTFFLVTWVNDVIRNIKEIATNFMILDLVRIEDIKMTWPSANFFATDLHRLMQRALPEVNWKLLSTSCDLYDHIASNRVCAMRALADSSPEKN